jgi:hypothetical protein
MNAPRGQPCPRCCGRVPVESRFCIACGSEVGAPLRAARFCVGCGGGLAADAKFCNGCGSAAAVVEAPHVHCTRCGTDCRRGLGSHGCGQPRWLRWLRAPVAVPTRGSRRQPPNAPLHLR